MHHILGEQGCALFLPITDFMVSCMWKGPDNHGQMRRRWGKWGLPDAQSADLSPHLGLIINNEHESQCPWGNVTSLWQREGSEDSDFQWVSWFRGFLVMEWKVTFQSTHALNPSISSSFHVLRLCPTVTKWPCIITFVWTTLCISVLFQEPSSCLAAFFWDPPMFPGSQLPPSQYHTLK